jgi:hypothetical protein
MPFPRHGNGISKPQRCRFHPSEKASVSVLEANKQFCKKGGAALTTASSSGKGLYKMSNQRRLLGAEINKIWQKAW